MFIDGETIEHAALRTLGGRSWASLPVAERRRLLGLLLQLVVAVQRLHARGIAHRDLNASHVWVAEDDRVSLLDPELAHAPGDPSPPLATGTLGFRSPQQAAREQPSFAADVFALGALVLLTLTGLDPRRPLGAGSDRTLRGQALAGRGADTLVACAARCVSEDPTLRPSIEDIERAVACEFVALGSRQIR
jgi:serine/threonine protein kinase